SWHGQPDGAMADPIRRAGPREEGGVAVRRATTAIPHIRAGRLRAIGYTGSVAPGFLYESSWQGIFAPAGTPPAILNRIQSEVAAVARNPKLRDVWAAGGHVVVASTLEEFGRFLRTYLQENAGAASDRRRSASVDSSGRRVRGLHVAMRGEPRGSSHRSGAACR
ncbi:MAG: tripartite tricarboxylate transporter substrate-binding protein, partial [Burkholderiales bacterium]